MYRPAFLLLVLTLGASAARAEEIVVRQKDREFSMPAATLNRGDKLKFVNDDTIAHNVLITGPKGETQDSGVQNPGESAVISFDKSGTYKIECGIHPHMQMSVTVK
jgi:plastocyanin